MNPLLNLIVGERYLFQATRNRTFIATFVIKYTNNIIVEIHSDEHYRMSQSQHSYPQADILDAFPLSELIVGEKYRFWYLEKVNNENKVNIEPEYYRKSHEGEFLEIVDMSETLRIDTRTNPEHLRMGIISSPLFKYFQIDKL